MLREQIGRLTGEGGRLGLGFIFGLAVALWSANGGMKAIIDALNVIYKEKETRSFIRLNLMSLAAIGALLVALGAVVVRPIAFNYLGLENEVAANRAGNGSVSGASLPPSRGS